MPQKDPKQTFYKYFPAGAADYCYQLWQDHAFHFKINRKRNSKLGDWRFDPQSKRHTITVNHDLNPFAFLITYVHEVAHLFTWVNHGRKAAPHGAEWKESFRQLLSPVLNEQVFPTELLSLLKKHMRNPKASTVGDHSLSKALKRYDLHESGTYLSDIAPGETFRFRGKQWRKEEKRRTRSLCTELNSGKRYLISELAEVEKD